jgi:hypothetical protein
MANLLSGINARIRGTNKAPAAPADDTANRSPMNAPPEDEKRSSDANLHTTATNLPESAPESAWDYDDAYPTFDCPRPLPLWLNPAVSKHIVVGNFLTLSARPKTVDKGEWLAHQVVEHYRNLWNFVRIVHEKEEDGSTICNPSTCPKMSAGKNHSFTWLNRNHQPVEIPAHEYMTLMQRWISSKMDDTAMFPTDANGVSFASFPGSSSTDPLLQSESDRWLGGRAGFPKAFGGTCQLIFRQIFRVYAHLYWEHYTDPLYHLNLEKQLNSCFSHFVLTATTLDMLQPDELEPMQYLIDLWAANGTFPPESRAYALADVERGRYLMAMGGMAR